MRNGASEDEGSQTVRYSIVIPVYRSGPWLEELARRIEAAMAPRGEAFEVLLVNDASPDAMTWPAIEDLARRHPWLRGFDMLYNVGQFKALLCGFEQARGEFVLTMDDDLQHPPEELPKLIDAMLANPEMLCVIGKYGVKQHSALRNLGSRGLAWFISKAYKKPPEITTTSFRIMRRELAETLAQYRTTRPLLGPMIVQLTRRVMNVTVEHHPRQQGKSGYSIWKLAARTLDGVIYASTAPLRFFTIIGLTATTAAFAMALFMLSRWTIGGIGVPGYTSLILTITFFSGIILMGIGILGEYIGRVVAEVSGPPKHRIRRIAGAAAAREAAACGAPERD